MKLRDEEEKLQSPHNCNSTQTRCNNTNTGDVQRVAINAGFGGNATIRHLRVINSDFLSFLFA